MLYCVVPVPGKDLGCVAVTTVEVGRVLLEERPLICVDVSVREQDTREVKLTYPAQEWDIQVERREFIKLGDCFLSLTPHDRARYCELKAGKVPSISSIDLAYRDLESAHGSLGAVSREYFSKIISIFQTNAFNNGLWLDLARVNHSCDPNAEVVWDEYCGTRRLVVVREITQGEEITHSYLHTVMDRNNRRNTLQCRWNFQCRCSLCNLTDSALARDDAMRLQFCETEARWKEHGDLPSLTLACSLARSIPGFRLYDRLRLLESLFLRGWCPTVTTCEEGYTVACTLLGTHTTTAARWTRRKESPLLCHTLTYITSVGSHLGSAVTGLVILLNFYQGEVTHFIVLVLVFLLYYKSH